MKRKLGIVSECLVGEDSVSSLEKIKKAGFDCFFTNRCDLESVSSLVKKADELGLTCDFIHAPFAGINNMWLAGMDYLNVMSGMKHSIDTAAAT